MLILQVQGALHRELERTQARWACQAGARGLGQGRAEGEEKSQCRYQSPHDAKVACGHADAGPQQPDTPTGAVVGVGPAHSYYR